MKPTDFTRKRKRNGSNGISASTASAKYRSPTGKSIQDPLRRRRRSILAYSSFRLMTAATLALVLSCNCLVQAVIPIPPPPLVVDSAFILPGQRGWKAVTHRKDAVSNRTHPRGRLYATTSTVMSSSSASALNSLSGGASGLQMISSMFRWRKNEDDEDEVLVNIEAPAVNIRRISSSIVVNRPLEDVWKILTDYDRLSEYVPNLTQSKTLPRPAGVETKGVRLFQEGAQTIIGFNFRASLTMDMEEVFEGEDEKLGQRRIKFKLVDSAMFSDFSGEWRLQCYSRMRTMCETEEWTYSTKLFYMVNVKPKGPVPVGALEWRIKEDVPTNLRAVKVASENLPWECTQDRSVLEALAAARREQRERMTVAKEWMADETLGAYIDGENVSNANGKLGSSSSSNSKEVIRVGVGKTTGALPNTENGSASSSKRPPNASISFPFEKFWREDA